jgi:small subunit ribosomal protein S6
VKEYEIVYVLRPDLSDEARAKKVERIHNLITENGGQVDKVDDWGKRILAYEIQHYKEGYYGLSLFKLPPQLVNPVSERLNIDEEILRYQIVASNK